MCCAIQYFQIPVDINIEHTEATDAYGTDEKYTTDTKNFYESSTESIVRHRELSTESRGVEL